MSSESKKVFEEHIGKLGWGMSNWDTREMLFDYVEYVRTSPFKTLKEWSGETWPSDPPA